jgi:hypothetical protein
MIGRNIRLSLHKRTIYEATNITFNVPYGFKNIFLFTLLNIYHIISEEGVNIREI